MIFSRVEDTLGTGYGGLFGEVVTCDTYQLRDLRWKPRVFIDVGANVGVAARFAHELWPDCLIVCVEPDAQNFENLVHFTHYKNFVFINKAIGQGIIYRAVGAINGAHECYISEGLGYTDLTNEVAVTKSEVETIMLDEIINEYYLPGCVVKLDCEGGENTIFKHPPSMEALKKADYICGEYHNMALHGGLIDEVRKVTLDSLHYFDDTHEVRIHHPNFWITKK